MWDEPDIDADTAHSIFTDKILGLTPSALTDNGFRCFDKFFRMVNLNLHGLSKWNRSCFITDNVEGLVGTSLWQPWDCPSIHEPHPFLFPSIGLDYLWDCILQVPDDISYKPIELMKDVFTNLSSKLPQEQVTELHVHVHVYSVHQVHVCALYTCTCIHLSSYMYKYMYMYMYIQHIKYMYIEEVQKVHVCVYMYMYRMKEG